MTQHAEYERLRRVLHACLVDAECALNLLPKKHDPLRDYIDNIRFNALNALNDPEHHDGEA